MNSDLAFKHSGTLGDLIYALPLVKHLGGGRFYLHMNQIDALSRQYYNTPLPPNHFHFGRMNQRDFEFMKSFMEAQNYIDSFEKMDPKTAEITHNLDRFRDLFVKHPGNYVDCYATAFNIRDPEARKSLRETPWLTVPNPRKIEGRTVVINRTARWQDPNLSVNWSKWQEEGIDAEALFVGLPEEFEAFKKATGWREILHYPTPTLLDMAEIIAGTDCFIGNQSVALALAVGLGVEFWCESRKDLAPERNECVFPGQPRSFYF